VVLGKLLAVGQIQVVGIPRFQHKIL